MSIIIKLKKLVVPELPKLQKLEQRYKNLCRKRLTLKSQGRVTIAIEAEIDQVMRRIRLIQEQRNQERQEEYQLLQSAYAELDEEFPGLKRLVYGDRKENP